MHEWRRLHRQGMIYSYSCSQKQNVNHITEGARTYADFSAGDSLVASPQNREGAYIYRFSHDFVKTETHHILMTQHK